MMMMTIIRLLETCILFMKATTLFSKEDRTIIFEAVNQVHHIVQRTTYLFLIIAVLSV